MSDSKITATDDDTDAVANEIIKLIESETDTLLSEAMIKQITEWTNEIAIATNSWVRILGTFYIVTSSWESIKVALKIKEALDKLKNK
ncbi:MAG: hypothetical protein K0Q53_699 [Massilibacillus sp.]|jgi:hypothetical protein|nr:hypothetical protein [Massilibacillus sp.]